MKSSQLKNALLALALSSSVGCNNDTVDYTRFAYKGKVFDDQVVTQEYADKFIIHAMLKDGTKRTYIDLKNNGLGVDVFEVEDKTGKDSYSRGKDWLDSKIVDSSQSNYEIYLRKIGEIKERAKYSVPQEQN